ncbi:MAG: hypothetical protein Q7O66_17500 [Dehalococcoidia bacterium]|nr:hypothetical protein [Dehalococcoidia bacterium]
MADTFMELIQRHGDVVGVLPLDPFIEDESGAKVRNPTPQYRYTFADGTYVVGKAHTANPNPTTAEIGITDPGTAMGAKATNTPADLAKDAYDAASYTQKLEELRNPKPTLVTKGNIAYQVTLGPDGKAAYEPVFNFPAEPAAPRQRTAADDQLAWQQARYPEETAYARGRDTLADAQKEQTRADLLQQNRLVALQNDQEREAANLRGLATNYTSAWNQALDFQLPEGQDYWSGFEPGGVQEQLMKRYGLPYTAPQATKVPFNPWQAAQQAIRR